MNSKFILAMILSGACGISMASECNSQTMDENTFDTCLVVEGSGQTWAEYQQDMRELEASILAKRQRQVQADIPSGVKQQ